MHASLVKRYCTPILAAWIIIAPIYWILILLGDTAFGNRQLINWLLFESRHALLLQTLKDSIAALPIALPTLTLVIIFSIAARKKHQLGGTMLALLVTALLVGIALLALGLTIQQGILFLSALLLASLLAVLFSGIISNDGA